MILVGNEPEFEPVAVGTCECCKRENVPLRMTEHGPTVCADIKRCALAVLGCPDRILEAEVPDGELWVVDP